jgi:asparagine synthetase B (glutamine-hydrolysing)
MCGIHLQVWKDPSCESCCLLRQQQQEQQQQTANNAVVDNLRRRGPDVQHSVTLPPKPGVYRQVELHASVLQMRHDLVQQPVRLFTKTNNENEDDNNIDDDDMYLCWNGEIYQTIEDDKAWDYEISDTQLVANILEQALGRVVRVRDNRDDRVSEDDGASPSPSSSSTAATAIANTMSSLYNAEFAFLILTPTCVLYGRDSWGRRSLLRWDCPNCGSFRIVSVAEALQSTITTTTTTTTSSSTTPAEEWTEILPGRVHQISFIQGAATTTTTDTTEPIPYSSLRILKSIESTSQSIKRTIIDSMLAKNDHHYATLQPPSNDVSKELWEASLILEFHLDNAVQMRMASSSSSTAVLFSGGLDSAVVAALAARQCYERNNSNITTSTTRTSLKLYNVSFGDAYEKSNDRKAALISYDALKRQYPNDTVVFRDIVVSWEELVEWETHIRTLLRPKTTLMDINIAAALWFASRGGGRRRRNDDDEEDTKDDDDDDKSSSPPRVLLLGMGADEQMGGYGRHRKAYERGGMEELQTELQMDQDRFWERNLGRDDRVCADHGKEARFPFLDTHVTNFLRQLPLELVCDFSLPPGQGDKRILRLVAMRLGLDHASGLVKRAIQFGSRISHLSDAKRFGSRRKAKGEATIGDVEKKG